MKDGKPENRPPHWGVAVAHTALLLTERLFAPAAVLVPEPSLNQTSCLLTTGVGGWGARRMAAGSGGADPSWKRNGAGPGTNLADDSLLPTSVFSSEKWGY